MKTKKILLVLASVMCLVIFAGCAGKSKLVGNWVWEESVSNYNYPNQLTINSDGTGLGDGIKVNWTTEKDVIKFTAGVYDSVSYKYAFKGSTLYLDEHPYKKVKK